MAIEASAEEALNAFVAMHGEQFRVDVHTFFEGHRGLTHDPCTIDEWNPDRRIKLLTACITDLADRARTMAASKFTVDCRYVFEKPGCLRMLCYLDGYNVLGHVEEPIGRAYRADTVGSAFVLDKNECVDARPANPAASKRDHKSRGNLQRADCAESAGEVPEVEGSEWRPPPRAAPVDKRCTPEPVSGNNQPTGAARMRAMETELGALRIGAAEDKEQRDKAQTKYREKRQRQADRKAARLAAAAAGEADPTSKAVANPEQMHWPLSATRVSAKAHVHHVQPPQGGEEPGMVELPVGWYSGENPFPAVKKLSYICPCDKLGVPFCPWFQTGMCNRGFDSAIPCCWRHEMLDLEHWPAQWADVFSAMGGHKSLRGAVTVASVLSLMDGDMAAATCTLPEATRQEALRYHLETRLSNLSKPTSEHLKLGPIQNGVGCSMRLVWGSELSV